MAKKKLVPVNKPAKLMITPKAVADAAGLVGEGDGTLADKEELLKRKIEQVLL